MRRYDDDTLQTMLSDPESDRVERKESFKGLKRPERSGNPSALLPTILPGTVGRASFSSARMTMARRWRISPYHGLPQSKPC